MSAHPDRLRHRVGEAIARHALWQAGDRVAVAVSGGRDSVVLIEILVATAGWHKGRLSVIHVDHQTRPETTDDAEFVQALAASHGVPFAGLVVPGGPEASEEALRNARYQAFATVDADRIALAHHRRDQAETVLLRLVAGAGARGLAGMAWRRGRYVRPMLDVPHAAIDRFARHRALAFREDPTNVDPRFLRNRVRAEVLPLLEAVRPGATGALARAASLLAEDEAFLASGLESRGLSQNGPWPLTAIQALPGPLFRRFCLRRQGLTSGQIDELTQLVARGYEASLVTSGWTWEVANGWLSVTPPRRVGG